MILATYWDNVEIFDMASGNLVDCPKVQQLPKELYAASGGTVDGSPMICGGNHLGNKIKRKHGKHFCVPFCNIIHIVDS